MKTRVQGIKHHATNKQTKQNKNQKHTVHICNPYVKVNGDRQVTGVCWPARPAELVSSKFKETLSQTKQNKTKQYETKQNKTKQKVQGKQ